MSIVISKNYTTTEEDYYIGVDSEKPVSITLLPDAKDGQEYVIKAEMKPPVGKRKITISTIDNSTIDGYSFYTICVSHDRVRLFRRDSNWYVI
jgi:hypothetical protein